MQEFSTCYQQPTSIRIIRKSIVQNNNYRFNIAKTCEICKKSFITDIFQEKNMCGNCESIYQVLETCEDDEEFIDNDISDVINSIVNQSNGRAVAVRYD